MPQLFGYFLCSDGSKLIDLTAYGTQPIFIFMSIRFIGGWRNIICHLEGEWKNKAKPDALKRVTAFYERQIKQNIESGGTFIGKPFTPLAENTIRRKGSSKPLIDTGEMLNSIKTDIIDDITTFVGIKAGTRHADGKEDTAMIAAVHEFGALIPGGEVPARPFIRPVFEDGKICYEAEKIMKKAFEEAEENQ